MKLWIVSFLVIILNLPFGYWRANVKKFSMKWFAAVHLSIPFIVLLRLSFGLGFAFVTYPALLGSDFLGHFLGGKIYTHKKSILKERVTSCMFLDFLFGGTNAEGTNNN